VTYQTELIYNSSFNKTILSEWGKIKHVVPQDLILGPSFFLLYTNDFPNIRADPLKPILFADDASIIQLQILVPQSLKQILTILLII